MSQQEQQLWERSYALGGQLAWSRVRYHETIQAVTALLDGLPISQACSILHDVETMLHEGHTVNLKSPRLQALLKGHRLRAALHAAEESDQHKKEGI